MKRLTVSLNVPASSPTAANESPLAVPLRVLDAEGSLIEEGAASAAAPAHFDLTGVDGPAFVRLTWPSGRTQTQRVEVDAGVDAHVAFGGESLSRDDWLAWAVPRLGGDKSVASTRAPDLGMERFDRVWLRTWVLDDGKWQPHRPEVVSSQQSNYARQLDLTLNRQCWLIQVGGVNLAWRFIALPGGGPCRVLLTPNPSDDPRAEPLKLLVTSFRHDAEALMELLARDEIRAANSVAAFEPVATRLLARKMEDPVSAIAGAYFLLRTGEWRQTPSWWFDNLLNSFVWLADPAVIACAIAIRQGGSSNKDMHRISTLLRTCLQRGVPLYAEGLTLLQETASVLRSIKATGDDDLFADIELFAASRAWAGAALSFYGLSPDDPSPRRIVGLPGSPRPASKKSSPLRKSSVNELSTQPDFVFLKDLK